MSIASLAKLGLQYGKTGLKYASVVPRYAFGEGYSVIQNARKSVGGRTIFQNFVPKAKIGFQTLKSDIIATASRPGLYAKAKAQYSAAVNAASAAKKLSSLQKIAAGTKGIASAVGKSISSTFKAGAAAATTGKYLGKLGKFGKALGGTKAVLKPLCKMPVIASLVTLGYETYENIYPAFKNEGFWAGLKETGKSCIKIAAGAALGAVGAACGGAIGGIAGYVAGEWIANKIMGASYAETHAAETEEANPEEQPTEVVQDETNTQALRDKIRSLAPEVETAQQSQEGSEQAESTDEAQATDQTTAQQTQNNSGLPEKLEPSDTSVQSFTSNPVAQSAYTTYSNPFGLDAGSNIFQRYPMGYKFQYQGNGFGMMA
jgi:hypothetical protein